MGPDERALRAELDSPRFEVGVLRSRWRFHNLNWPHLLLSVVARDGIWFGFRCECSQFPSKPPDVQLWDVMHDQPLVHADFPQVNGGPAAKIFRTDWENGQHIYHPMDRKATDSHPDWKNTLRIKAWKPDRGIVQLLEELYAVLHSQNYQPRTQSAA